MATCYQNGCQNGCIEDESGSDLSENEEFPMEALFEDGMFTLPQHNKFQMLNSSGESGEDADGDEEDDDMPATPPKMMTLRQRRLSRSALPKLPSLTMKKTLPVRIIESKKSTSSSSSGSPRMAWKRAFEKLKKLRDPWAEFEIDKYPAEKATRHRYNALKKKWVTDTVTIKMEQVPFNHGAMRECYRLKKSSNIKHSKSWKNTQNYVAKTYMLHVDREVYFEDVRLQMDAKLWGEEYNRHNPPKKVDIFQLSILEFENREEGDRLFHLEHFIEGEYIKYNSNSGFVDEHMRMTPHAFSHFTFERSGHEIIVVDIQGVGDLYTDPQVHTSDGIEYGDGNLGTRGMALFFHSHTCNSICESLNLSPFDLARKEINSQQEFINLHQNALNAMTVVRGCEEMCMSPSPKEKIDLSKFIRQRTISTCSTLSDNDSSLNSPIPDSDGDCGDAGFFPFMKKLRFVSESEKDTISEEEDRIAFRNATRRQHRPSCIANEIRLRRSSSVVGQKDLKFDSVLGNVHHDLAKYHESARFVMNDNDIDWDAALFHEEHAAKLGVMEAIITMAKLYLGLPRDILVSCEFEDKEENILRGIEYMETAAEAGDRGCMIYLAKSYETGANLGTPASFKDWSKAAHWYEEAIEKTESDTSGHYDSTLDNPLYMLQAKLAGLLQEGGHGLEKDPNRSGEMYSTAAESATASMNGKLAAKYYMLAEEAWAECEEEED